MKIREIALTVRRPDTAAAFYRDVLKMPVDEQPDRVTVTVGFSRLVLTRGERFDGVHHLAFGISPHGFDHARTWLSDRVDLIVAGDSDVVVGPTGWDSRSLYFLGPEGIVLEFIARQADAAIPPGDRIVPRPFSISEIGISVPDPTEAVGELGRTLRLPTFPPQGPHFAPVGDHDGLLIVVHHDRVWFPTRTQRASHGPLAVRIDTSGQPRQIALTEKTTITAVPVGSS